MKKPLVHSAAALLMLVAQPLWAACNPAIAITKPDAIYTDHSNGTVTDEQTGLMWMQCSEGQSGATCAGTAMAMNWQTALAVAQTANSDNRLGYSDWRLPNVAELRSLVEAACYSPAINSALFPATPPNGYYWSASAYANSSSNAWLVHFNDGNELSHLKSTSRYVRLVRGQ